VKLKKGVNDGLDSMFAEPPVHRLCLQSFSRGHLHMAKMLLDKGGNLETEYPLRVAKEKGHKEIESLLRARGAEEWNMRGFLDLAPLRMNPYEIVSLLVPERPDEKSKEVIDVIIRLQPCRHEHLLQAG
jgi:hypothetical protein